jgi:hypothetical protein
MAKIFSGLMLRDPCAPSFSKIRGSAESFSMYWPIPESEIVTASGASPGDRTMLAATTMGSTDLGGYKA